MNANSPMIRLENLQKEYQVRRRTGPMPWQRPRESVWALRGVDLEIPRGEFFGLLGPNGAGKTTLVKILCTLLIPTRGHAWVGGRNVIIQDRQVRQMVGVTLTAERGMYWKLTGRENLLYYAALYGLSSREATKRAQTGLELMGLSDRADDLVEQYSTGMRQRLAIARSLLHDPPLLLLDEPTSGLDPRAARNVRALIVRLRQEFGKTILLTTHNLHEAEQLCDRVGILREGRLIALDTPARLKRQVMPEQVIELEVEPKPSGLTAALAALPGVIRVETPENGRVRLLGKEDEMMLDLILQRVSEQGGRVSRVVLDEPSLEDVFFHLVPEQVSSMHSEEA